MTNCNACAGTRKDCTVCEGYGRAPGCATCHTIPDSKLPSDTSHECETCGTWWGLDTRGRRYWVAHVGLQSLRD